MILSCASVDEWCLRLFVMEVTKFVDLEMVCDLDGFWLVVVVNIPSFWFEVVKGIFRIKCVLFVVVCFGFGDGELRKWTRVWNVFVAMYEKELGCMGWVDIFEFVERIVLDWFFVPKVLVDRMKMFGLSYEFMGEGGLFWLSRLVSIDFGFESGGECGFFEFVVSYFGVCYGYSKFRMV